MDYARLRANLKRARGATGMTQEAAEFVIPTGHGNVSKWETGKVVPNLETLESLAQAYGTTVRRLLTGVYQEGAW